MKKTISILLLSLLFVANFTGCSKSNNSSKEAINIESIKSDSSKEVINIDSALKLSHSYNSIKELKDESFDMVEVNVKSNESLMYMELGFTISTVEVNSSIKGKFQVGEQIRIVETGGKYKYTGTDPKIKPGQLIEQTCDGIPVMKVSGKYVIFINKYQGGITKDAYKILGVYQGKFKIDNDVVIQETPKENKIKNLESENVDKFKKDVKEIK